MLYNKRVETNWGMLIRGDKMKYCLNCKKNVEPQWQWFGWLVTALIPSVIFFFFGLGIIFSIGIFILVMVIGYNFNHVCPICKASNFRNENGATAQKFPKKKK
jgi:hypothetical protein